MRSRNAARREETRATLLAVARKLFGKKGFADTGTEEIVAAARLTRGALYYHFPDKTALFAAVVEEIAAEILIAIDRAAAAMQSGDPLDGFLAGCRAYLDACLAPAVRRIYVIDAPSVLGPARLREIDARYAASSLREGVEALLAAHPAQGASADALTALLSGALDEAVLWLVRNDGAVSRSRLDETFEAMVRGVIRAAARSRRAK